MIYGANITSGFGDHEQHVKSLRFVASESGFGWRIYFTPSTGFGDAWYGVYRNADLVSLAYAPADTEVFGAIQSARGDTTSNIAVLRHGTGHGSPMPHIARIFDAASPRASLRWQWASDVIGCEVSDGTEYAYLSGWALTGLSAQTISKSGATRGYLGCSIVVAAGTATVTISRGGVDVASGSSAVDATLTLTEINGSGIAGTVDVAALADTSAGMVIRIRWPEYAAILRDETSPPTTEVDTVRFAWADSAAWSESDDMDAGTYYYAVSSYSDTGVAGAATSPATITISAAPEPPTGLAYASGDASATTLSFVPSTTDGAAYNLYLQEPDQSYMDIETPAATAIADAESIALPAISGYAGYAFAWLRAVHDGIEEQLGARVRLEYDADGAIVLARPNLAHVESVSSIGTTVTAVAVVDTRNEAGLAASARVFSRVPGGSFDRASPVDTEELSASMGELKSATMTWTSAAGWIELAADAVTEAGGQSADTGNIVRHYVSSDGGETPTEFYASHSRG